jgi:hypothetical protein
MPHEAQSESGEDVSRLIAAIETTVMETWPLSWNCRADEVAGGRSSASFRAGQERSLAQFHELSMEQNALFHQSERVQLADTSCKREVECYAYPCVARRPCFFSKTGYGEPADKTTD